MSLTVTPGASIGASADAAAPPDAATARACGGSRDVTHALIALPWNDGCAECLILTFPKKFYRCSLRCTCIECEMIIHTSSIKLSHHGNAIDHRVVRNC